MRVIWGKSIKRVLVSRQILRILNSFKYDEEKVSLDKYTIIEEAGQRDVYNWLQYYDKESITKELEKNGFTVTEIYSDVAGTKFDKNSNDIALIAKKVILIVRAELLNR